MARTPGSQMVDPGAPIGQREEFPIVSAIEDDSSAALARVSSDAVSVFSGLAVGFCCSISSRRRR